MTKLRPLFGFYQQPPCVPDVVSVTRADKLSGMMSSLVEKFDEKPVPHVDVL